MSIIEENQKERQRLAREIKRSKRFERLLSYLIFAVGLTLVAVATIYLVLGR